jgi:hypothetical protein
VAAVLQPVTANAMKTPRLAIVMLVMLGLFELTAACGTLIDDFVRDRVDTQFVPVCRFLASPFVDGEPSERLCRSLAVASQWIIGLTELLIGVALLLAAMIPQKRVFLSDFGLSLAMGLFGTFAITMFAMHDHTLPKWNQYPAMLAWYATTWLVVRSAVPKSVQAEPASPLGAQP